MTSVIDWGGEWFKINYFQSIFLHKSSVLYDNKWWSKDLMLCHGMIFSLESRSFKMKFFLFLFDCEIVLFYLKDLLKKKLSYLTLTIFNVLKWSLSVIFQNWILPRLSQIFLNDLNQLGSQISNGLIFLIGVEIVI